MSNYAFPVPTLYIPYAPHFTVEKLYREIFTLFHFDSILSAQTKLLEQESPNENLNNPRLEGVVKSKENSEYLSLLRIATIGYLFAMSIEDLFSFISDDLTHEELKTVTENAALAEVNLSSLSKQIKCSPLVISGGAWVSEKQMDDFFATFEDVISPVITKQMKANGISNLSREEIKEEFHRQAITLFTALSSKITAAFPDTFFLVSKSVIGLKGAECLSQGKFEIELFESQSDFEKLQSTFNSILCGDSYAFLQIMQKHGQHILSLMQSSNIGDLPTKTLINHFAVEFCTGRLQANLDDCYMMESVLGNAHHVVPLNEIIPNMNHVLSMYPAFVSLVLANINEPEIKQRFGLVLNLSEFKEIPDTVEQAEVVNV